MPAARFSTHFWDKDFTGTLGYEALLKRLKDGRKVCDDFSDLVRQRAKVEEEYGRSLVKLSTHSVGTEEIGTLRQSIDDLKKALENVGNCHLEFSRRLQEDIEKNARDFKERQRNERQKIDEKMKRCQRDKKLAYENVLKCKRAYEQKCKEKDLVEENLDSRAVWTPKEEEKLRAKVSKSKTVCENADTTYQTAVKMLEDIRAIWEREMENSCNQFQSLEEERIKFMRNEAWLYTNLGSLASVGADQSYESVRLSLEKCNATVDIQLFIHSKETGTDRPVPITYENYYYSAEPVPPEMQKPDHATVIAKISAPVNQQAYNPNAHANRLAGQNHTTDGGGGIGQQRFSRYVKVAFSYAAQGPEELSLKEGDVIEVLRIENKEWGYGQISRNGFRGVFPLNFVVQS